jgi:hypothetical protein
MIRIAAVMALAAVLGAAQQGERKATAAKKAAASAKNESATVPPDAVLVGEGTWRHTDSEGKTWTYRRTPFGLIKMAGAPEQSAEGNSSLRVVSVTPGEIEFESVTPFAKPRWKRQRNALTPEEQVALKRYETAQSNSPAKQGK